MTGQWHYREAERLLDPDTWTPDDPTWRRILIAKAQVHATLSLAASRQIIRVVERK